MSDTVGDAYLYGTDADESRQREALVSGDIPVAVYGLGKMGLPLAGVYADLTGNVMGADVDPAVVESVNRGDCHVDGEPGLAELVDRTVNDGSLQAVSDPATAAETARLHVVIVPTLITDEGRADLTIVESVVEEIAQGLHSGDLVVIESTVPPRTCEDVIVPLLEAESGLSLGEFGVAFCPERTESGRAIQDIRGSWPKVVGGVDSESTRAAALVYDQLTSNDVIRASDATTAESVKVFEGVYRDVNIALANELATYTDDIGIDVREAIAVANTVDESDILRPGPGVGGHCIPYYPYFLFGEFDNDSPLLRTAREVNDEMPAFVVGKLASLLSARDRPLSDASVLVLGGPTAPGSPKRGPARRLASPRRCLPMEPPSTSSTRCSTPSRSSKQPRSTSTRATEPPTTALFSSRPTRSSLTSTGQPSRIQSLSTVVPCSIPRLLATNCTLSVVVASSILRPRRVMATRHRAIRQAQRRLMEVKTDDR